MSQPLIVFSHGNSFPASTYGVMLDDLRQRGFQVKAIEKLGHNTRYPVSNNWPHLVQELTDFVAPLAIPAPVFLVGHSLGGFLSMMVAAQSPALVHGVVLLDSPMLGGWRANLLKVGDLLDDAVLDKYTFVRDAHLQRRLSLVNDGNVPEAKPASDANP